LSFCFRKKQTPPHDEVETFDVAVAIVHRTDDVDIFEDKESFFKNISLRYKVGIPGLNLAMSFSFYGREQR
jgi:hypothetical protein